MSSQRRRDRIIGAALIFAAAVLVAVLLGIYAATGW